MRSCSPLRVPSSFHPPAAPHSAHGGSRRPARPLRRGPRPLPSHDVRRAEEAPPAKYSGASWAAGRARPLLSLCPSLPPSCRSQWGGSGRGGAQRGPGPRAGGGRHGGALRGSGGEGRRRAPARARAWGTAGPGDERSPGRHPPREYGHSRVQKEDAQERGHVVRGGQSEVGAEGEAGGASGWVPGPCSPLDGCAGLKLTPKPSGQFRSAMQARPGVWGMEAAGVWLSLAAPIPQKAAHTAVAAGGPFSPQTLSLGEVTCLLQSLPPPPARPQHPQGLVCVCRVGKQRGFVSDGSV